MKIVLGIPIIDQHEMTRDLLETLDATTIDPRNLKVFIIDNASENPYTAIHDLSFDVEVIRNERNEGFYWPLLQVVDHALSTDLVGLCHNDLLFYENGWDLRVRESFDGDAALGMLGFCGSDQVDYNGGRGGGTMCFFRGTKGQSQAAGLRIRDLRPAVVLDSLFMVMRQPVVDFLEIDDGIVPCHFMDRIWPMRIMEKGWKVGVLGIEIDHLGGMTEVAMIERYQMDAAVWCAENNIDSGNDPALAIYKEAERRFLSEFRDEKHLIPSQMKGWDLVRG